MSQKTLDETPKEIPFRQPFSRLMPSHRKIYNFLNSMQRGYTHDQIRQVLKSTGISTFDNRLRELRKMGWVISHEDKSGLLLWFAVPKEALG